jgi:hypothetical protein
MKSIIHSHKEVFSKKSCNQLIDWFEKNTQHASPGGGGTEPLNNLEINITIEKQESFFGLGFAIEKGIKSFLNEYKLFNDCLKPWGLDTSAQLCKFNPNNYYNYIHCENDGFKNKLNRVFAWMIYLNNIKEGGGTEFIHQNITLIPKAGDFHVWPAGPSHMHRGVSAPEDNKYIVTGWFNFL